MDERERLKEHQGRSVVLGDTQFIAVSFTFYPLLSLKKDEWVQTRVWSSGYVCFNYLASSIDEAVFWARNALPCAEEVTFKSGLADWFNRVIWKMDIFVKKQEFETGALVPVIADGEVMQWKTIASVDLAHYRQVASEFKLVVVLLDSTSIWKGLSLDFSDSVSGYVSQSKLNLVKVEARRITKKKDGYQKALDRLARKNGHISFSSMVDCCRAGSKILKCGLRVRSKLRDRMMWAV